MQEGGKGAETEAETGVVGHAQSREQDTTGRRQGQEIRDDIPSG